MPSREYFLKGRDEKALKSYEDYVVNVAVAMGASRERAQTEIAQMIDFEILLANVSQPATFVYSIWETSKREKCKNSIICLATQIHWLINFMMCNAA